MQDEKRKGEERSREKSRVRKTNDFPVEKGSEKETKLEEDPCNGSQWEEEEEEHNEKCVIRNRVATRK